MPIPHVAIIVLNWNNGQDTLHCLNSLKKLDYPNFSVIICDNASTDDSFNQLDAWMQELHHFPTILLQTGSNLGFAGGNNVGIRHALSKNCDYLWVLNNDTEVHAAALSALVQHAESHLEQALIGSTLLEFDQRTQVQCAGGCRYFPLLTVFRPLLAGKSLDKVMQQAATQIQLDYVAGAALFLRAEAVRIVGLLNDSYFLFYEELDYTQRLKQHGFAIGWCPASWVYHKGSATIGRAGQTDKAKLQRANYYENLSTLKYTARFHPHLLIPVMMLRFTLKSLIVLLRGQIFLWQPLWQAYRDFLRLSLKNKD